VQHHVASVRASARSRFGVSQHFYQLAKTSTRVLCAGGIGALQRWRQQQTRSLQGGGIAAMLPMCALAKKVPQIKLS
jgi:hypothetical protein